MGCMRYLKFEIVLGTYKMNYRSFRRRPEFEDNYKKANEGSLFSE